MQTKILHNSLTKSERISNNNLLNFYFETPSIKNDLKLKSDKITCLKTQEDASYTHETFNINSLTLLKNFFESTKLYPETFFFIFSQLLTLIEDLIPLKIQLKLIYDDFIYIDPKTHSIKLLKSSFLTEFCNDPHDIYFNKIIFKETIQFMTKLIYKSICDKPLLDSLDFSHDEKFNKKTTNFFKCNITAQHLIEFLFETNINNQAFTPQPFFQEKFKKIISIYNTNKSNTEKLYKFSTKPINKKLIIQQITKSIKDLKKNQTDICYFIKGDDGSGKKYIQQYVTFNLSKEDQLFSLNISFDESTQNDYTPFLNCFKWFIKQCIANSNNIFFNNHFFSTFSRNDQILNVSLFPEIQYYLKDFPIPTTIEKNNAMSYNMNIVIENLTNLFIIKTALLINIYNSNNISNKHAIILKNILTKITTPKVITNAYNTENPNNKAHLDLNKFLKSEFESKSIHLPLATKENINTFIKNSYLYPIKKEPELIKNLYEKTRGNLFSLKHLIMLLHSKRAIYLENNHIHWSETLFQQLAASSTITQHINKNISTLTEELKYPLKILACFENNISINHLNLLNKKIDFKKIISSLIDNQFLNYEIESNSQSINERKLKFRNNYIYKHAFKLTTSKQKKEIRFSLGHLLFDNYKELNFENTMLMTFCLSENFPFIYTKHNPKFIFNHALSLSKLFRNKGNYKQGNYFLTKILKTIKQNTNAISSKEFKFLLIEKAYHLHFLKKYKLSHNYFLQAINLTNDLTEKLNIGHKEVLLYNKKRDFLNGYQATRKYLKLVNINYPKNPNNKLIFSLMIISNLFQSLIKILIPLQIKKNDIPKQTKKTLEIILSNLEMSIGTCNQTLLLCQVLQAYNFSIRYKTTSFLYYSKTSFLLFLSYVNIIYLPYKLFKKMPPPKFKTLEHHLHKTEFVANSFIKFPFTPLEEIEQSFQKNITFFISQDNMFFTYASIFSKLFTQYLNGTPLNTIHESISKYYEWAKNYMHPLSLYENYLDFFTTLHKNKLGFENRITLNFVNNDTYFTSTANLKLIIYYFYSNQHEKAVSIFPKIKLNASTGPWFFTFKYYESLIYGFLTLTKNKKFYKKFIKSSKIYSRLKRNKEFKLNNISTLLELISCLCKNKLDTALILYNKLPQNNTNLLAIANETLGIYFKNKNINIQSNMYFTKSLNDYAKWGNNLKYNCLKEKLKNTFPELNLDYFNTHKKINNLLSCIKIAHTISNERETNNIIKSLMNTIQEHVSSYHISCILSIQGELNLFSQLIKNTYTMYNNTNIRNHKNKIPLNLINYTFKTKETIKLASLQNSISFYDNYINLGNQNSAICIPLINQDAILGVLYIERNQLNPFNNDDTLFLNIICTHVTNSLKNSMLYEKNKALINNLEEKVKDQIDAIKLKEQEKIKSEEIAKKAIEQSAYATLTRGIAHEIRNPMAIMLSGIELIQENIENKDKTIEYLNAVKESILRLKNITTTMLRYGKSVAEEKSLENINSLLEDALIVSSAECKKRQIKVNKSLAPIPNTIIDPNSISQVFLNLILNSIQAIKKKGTITVCSNVISGNSVPMIEISITDTGVGISKNNITKIFNPFYTSKYENAGLGLSIVLKIINEHNGKMDVDSKVNEFTTFKVLLPIISS